MMLRSAIFSAFLGTLIGLSQPAAMADERLTVQPAVAQTNDVVVAQPVRIVNRYVYRGYYGGPYLNGYYGGGFYRPYYGSYGYGPGYYARYGYYGPAYGAGYSAPVYGTYYQPYTYTYPGGPYYW